MDKLTFLNVLEASILSFDGATLEYIVKNGINEQQAKAGISLCNYLKNINFETR